MPEHKHIVAAFTVAACIVLAGITLLANGCGHMRAIDDAIWNPTPPAPVVNPDGTITQAPVNATDAPPLIEVLAALLATAGLGGMANWIRIVKNAANGKSQDLADRLLKLETHVADSEKV